MTINTLILEDHPITSDCYKKLLMQIQEECEFIFNISIASNCEEAQYRLNEYKGNGKKIHLSILDINIVPCKSENLFNGEDVAIALKKNNEETLIMLCTGFCNSYLLSNSITSFKPKSILIKEDFDALIFKNAVKAVLSGANYFSKSASKIIESHFDLKFRDINTQDRKILYELSIGSRIIDMENCIALSKSGIETRKKNLKEIFDAKNDRELIQKAKDYGFL